MKTSIAPTLSKNAYQGLSQISNNWNNIGNKHLIPKKKQSNN